MRVFDFLILCLLIIVISGMGGGYTINKNKITDLQDQINVVQTNHVKHTQAYVKSMNEWIKYTDMSVNWNQFQEDAIQYEMGNRDYKKFRERWIIENTNISKSDKR